MGCEKLPEKNLRYEDNRSKSLEIFSNQYTESSGNPTNRGKTPLQRNNHPTVKPLKLMEYLCILTKTPTGGTVLDPFGGTGTTGMACKKTGRDYILIEKEPEYVKIAQARLNSIGGKQVNLNKFKGD